MAEKPVIIETIVDDEIDNESAGDNPPPVSLTISTPGSTTAFSALPLPAGVDILVELWGGGGAGAAGDVVIGGGGGGGGGYCQFMISAAQVAADGFINVGDVATGGIAPSGMGFAGNASQVQLSTLEIAEAGGGAAGEVGGFGPAVGGTCTIDPAFTTVYQRDGATSPVAGPGADGTDGAAGAGAGTGLPGSGATAAVPGGDATGVGNGGGGGFGGGGATDGGEGAQGKARLSWSS